MDLPSAPPPPALPQPTPAHGRLDSWKQIATYLGRGVTTVQRWEQDEGLPVHRLPHAKKGSVFAFRHELDAWLAARAQSPRPVAAAAQTRATRGVSGRLVLVTAAVATVVVASIMALRWAGDRPSVMRAAAPVLPRPLANGIEAEVVPSLSPDGSHVVYARRRGTLRDLLIKPTSGGRAEPLAIPADAGVSQVGYPAWSPRGDLIAFLNQEGGYTFGLFVVPPRGGVPRRVTTIGGIGLCWTPDGSRIAFADRPAPGQPFAIHSMTIDGGERVRLTTPPAASFGDTFCSFSPDGRSLAIVRYATRHECNVHVVSLRSGDTTSARQLTSTLNGINGIVWTPDGTSILAGTSQGLWSVPVNGAEEPRLVAGLEGSAAYPAIARATGDEPARLVYQYHQRDVNVWRWRSAGASAGDTRRITESTWWEDLPSLAPDGRRVAFLSNHTARTELWTADSDGSNARQLTFGHGRLVLSPQWSADGQQVAYSATVDGNRDVYVIDTRDAAVRRITSASSEDGNPSWSRDGRWIYFRSDRDGRPQIWKAPASGGHATRVTTSDASQGFESPDGTLLYFVRNSPAPGLYSVPLAGGPVTQVLPDVREGFWGVADGGIAYIPSEHGNGDGTFDVRFFDFATRTRSVLARLRAPIFPLSPGFAVSRDARSVYWTQVDSDRDDIMLIDPWDR